MKLNKFLMLFIVLAFTVILSACNFGDEDEPAEVETTDDTQTETPVETEKVMNVLIPSEPPSLHPQLSTDTTSGIIIQNTFEGLVTMVDGEPELTGATDYEVSDDLLTYTFTLRDAKWSNGDTVTADDYAYAWLFALNAENASEYATILYPIKGAQAYNLGEGSAEDVGIKVIDSKTIEITLEAPTPYFLELLAFKTYYPIHKATAEANPQWYTEADGYVSNGAFTLADWQHGGSITLEKNEQYWDAAVVNLATVNIEMVESEVTQITKFDNGEIDFLGPAFGSVSLDAIDRLKADGKLQIEDYTGVYMYKFNTTDEIMSNANIRKALTLAIDRTSLIKNITKGEQIPALGLVPNSVEGFGDDAGYYKDNDIEGAKAALAEGLKELGLSDPSELNITLSFNTNEAHSSIAQFIQEGWSKNLGINVKLDNAEWQVYLDKLSNLDYQIGRLGWIADYNDAYTFLEQYDSATNGNNDTGWENPEYTQLLTQSKSETDPAKRIELLLQAEEIFMSELPVAPIYYYTNLYVKQDYVQNMAPDVLGNINLKYVDITK